MDFSKRDIRIYTADDGSELGYVAYEANDPPRRTALIYLHGIESHAGWFDRAARLLAARGFDVFCLDRRGSGVNRENRGFVTGDVDNFRRLLCDIHAFRRTLSPDYASVHVVGLSWGGKLAVAYAIEYHGMCDGLILITPGLRAAVDLSLGLKLKVALCAVFRPTSGIPLPIEPEMFTPTPEIIEYIRSDPLRLHHATARFLLQSRLLDRFIDRGIAGMRLPILLFLAGKDRIIDNAGVAALLRRGGRQALDTLDYHDQTHSIQFDAPQRMVDDMTQWLNARTETPRG